MLYCIEINTANGRNDVKHETDSSNAKVSPANPTEYFRHSWWYQTKRRRNGFPDHCRRAYFTRFPGTITINNVFSEIDVRGAESDDDDRWERKERRRHETDTGPRVLTTCASSTVAVSWWPAVTGIQQTGGGGRDRTGDTTRSMWRRTL